MRQRRASSILLFTFLFGTSFTALGTGCKKTIDFGSNQGGEGGAGAGTTGTFTGQGGAELVSTCGDDHCDPEWETAEDCPQDCGHGEGGAGMGGAGGEGGVGGGGPCTGGAGGVGGMGGEGGAELGATCGDGYCDPRWETASDCPQDCLRGQGGAGPGR